jgi:hypothetical protein
MTIPVHAIDPTGEDVAVNDPTTCKRCSDLGRVCDQPCECKAGAAGRAPTVHPMIATALAAVTPKENAMTKDEKIQELQKRLDNANDVERIAREIRMRIELELEEARGDDLKVRWSRALMAQDHELAHRCLIESVARTILRFGGEVGDHALSDVDRVAVAAEVERLRAEIGSKD